MRVAGHLAQLAGRVAGAGHRGQQGLEMQANERCPGVAQQRMRLGVGLDDEAFVVNHHQCAVCGVGECREAGLQTAVHGRQPALGCVAGQYAIARQGPAGKRVGVALCRSRFTL